MTLKGAIKMLPVDNLVTGLVYDMLCTGVWFYISKMLYNSFWKINLSACCNYLENLPESNYQNLKIYLIFIHLQKIEMTTGILQ